MANAVVNKILDFFGVDNGEAVEDEEMMENEYPYAYEGTEVEEQDEEERGIFKT